MTTAKKKFTTLVLSVVMTLALCIGMIPLLGINANAAEVEPTESWSTHVATNFAGGTGTETNPYRIQTAAQLAKLSKDVADGKTYRDSWFKLTNDLDLSAYRWIPIGQYRWELDGTSISNTFEGNFDGNGKTIKGIYVNEQTDAVSGGLFGYVESNSETVIRDVTIENAVIYGTEQGLTQGYNGILSANMLANEGHSLLVENVTVSGTISIVGTDGYYVAGGIVGDACRVKFVDCNVTELLMNAVSNSGGFAGMASNCYFENCRASGTVSGRWAMGGFIGYTTLSTYDDPKTNSTFVRCVTDVELTASDWNAGGFVGYSEGGVFEHCAVLGDVHSTVT